MTKLLEWLTVLGVLFSIWYALVTEKVQNSLYENHYHFLLFSPAILVLLFGIYAIFTVLYRTLTFNDCEEAAVELQKEIQDAKADLKKLGFDFRAKA